MKTYNNIWALGQETHLDYFGQRIYLGDWLVPLKDFKNSVFLEKKQVWIPPGYAEFYLENYPLYDWIMEFEDLVKLQKNNYE